MVAVYFVVHSGINLRIRCFFKDFISISSEIYIDAVHCAGRDTAHGKKGETI